MRELRNDNAVLQKRILELEDENKFLKGEIRGMSHRKGKDSTTDKINLAMEKRWYWLGVYTDRILIPSLAQIHSLIILAILYLTFGGKIP